MAQREMGKTYDFQSTEQRLYAWWNERGFFQPSNDPRKPDFDPTRKPFVISIPPPNVTGELHLGHAMFVAMEDLMIRYQRMKGVPTLWVPGSDHAGIATQLQVEKMLASEGLRREQLGREEFLRRTWNWKKKYGGMITEQIRRLGASCDWTRERFTLDDGLSRAVREAFVRLYEKGLIYRGPRLINWSPGLRTAVSDLEVEYSEEPGTLYYFKYMLEGSKDEFIPVATTRPETILGDTAVAVHPDDARYQRFIGKNVVVPILGRVVPVIADEYVDREFGTGALKITPGHDPNDYAIGQKFNLPVISVLDETAAVNENGGRYAGLDRFECRKQLWKDMGAQGLVIREEPYTLNVPRSQRGGEIVEPMISTQWFVKIQPLADAAMEAVKDGRIRIVPERFTKVYFNWLENIQDWCISRQLWWGHRIPVWYCDACGAETCAREDLTHCPQCGSEQIRQDPDVLDTWFSSALWPFSTLGWPEETPDYRYFYPTSILETGYDILFFWVVRMIMAGLEFTGKVPFEIVYLHGLIRDEFGQKMSKTKGNVIDPLDVMDEMGTDALRFTVLVGSTPGNDMNLAISKVEANRNFVNKVWNATRFVVNAISQTSKEMVEDASDTLADRWIAARLAQLVRDVNRLFDGYQYGEAGRQIYEFFWSEFADWYVEVAKLQIAEGGVRAFRTVKHLVRTLDTCLRLLHPFIPFVTEEAWGHLKESVMQYLEMLVPAGGWEDALMVARWTESTPEKPEESADVANFGLVMEIIRSIRYMRVEKKVTPGKKIAAVIAAGEKATILQEQKSTICALSHLDGNLVQIVKILPEKPQRAASTVVAGVEIYLPLTGLVDVETERTRLQKELNEIETQIARLETLLGGSFAHKAPAAVVDKERQKLEVFRESQWKLKEQLENLKGE